MDIDIDYEIFEPDGISKKEVEIPQEILSDHKKLLKEFLGSGYFENSILMIDRFLLPDRTIDLEKLELGIILAIEYLEFSVKSENPIYVFLGNMESYFGVRNIDPDTEIERVIEESTFILGFCQSIADENYINRKVKVQFRKIEDED